MKKLFIGLGIGCGIVVVVGIVVVIAGGFWLKRKAAQKFGDVQKFTAELKAQEDALKQLDNDFPFAAPAQGELMKLDETRLKEYIAIRKEGLPVFKQYEMKAKSLNSRTHDGKKGGVSEALEAMGIVSGLVSQLRTTFISSLRQHHMSPLEYHTTTAAVYTTYIHKGMQAAGKATDEAREKIQKEMGALTDKLNEPNLPEDARDSIQHSIDDLQTALDSLPASSGGGGDSATTDANARLLEQYKSEIDAAANPAFDLFISSEDASKAFANAFSAPSR